MLRRSVRMEGMQGHWEFPGFEFESIAGFKIPEPQVFSPLCDALKRSVFKATRADIIVADLIPVFRELATLPKHPRYRGNVLITLFFSAYLKNYTRLKNLRHSLKYSGMAWVNAAEIRCIATVPGTLEVANMIKW